MAFGIPPRAPYSEEYNSFDDSVLKVVKYYHAKLNKVFNEDLSIPLIIKYGVVELEHVHIIIPEGKTYFVINENGDMIKVERLAYFKACQCYIEYAKQKLELIKLLK